MANMQVPSPATLRKSSGAANIGTVEGALSDVLINRARVVESVAGLSAVENPVEGQVVRLKSWRPGAELGGNYLVWRASEPRANHDGGLVHSPSVPAPVDFSDPAQVAGYLAGVGEALPLELGCWCLQGGVEITPEIYGANHGDIDSFASHQAAINAGNVKYGPYVYSLDLSVNVAIYSPSNRNVVMNPETVIKVLDGANNSTGIFRIWGVANVYIDGNGANIIGDNASRVSVSEAQHGVFISESSSVRVSNLKCSGFQGDGIYVGAATTQCSLVVLDNCECTDNSRQGLSITHADNVIVSKGKYYGNGVTNSASPRAGIDLEPNTGQIVSNISLIDVELFNNVDGGILIQDGNGPVYDVTVEACHSHDNGAVWGGMFVTTAKRVHAINNKMIDNASWGIKYQASAADCNITGNMCRGNAGDGYVLTSTSRMTVFNNRSISNGGVGYNISNLQKSEVHFNKSYDDALQGFFFSAQIRKNKIAFNHAEESGAEGIYFFDRVTDNEITDNIVEACGRAADVTYGAYRCRTEFAGNTVARNKSILASSGNQVSYGCVVDGTLSINNSWDSNTFAGQVGRMNFTSLTAQQQKGKTVSVPVGNVSAASGYSAGLLVAGGTGLNIVSASIVNAGTIVNDAANYTTFDIQNKGTDGAGVATVFSVPQWTRAGFAPININAYRDASFDLNVNAFLAAGEVLGFSKSDAGTGAPLSGALVKIEYVEC